MAAFQGKSIPKPACRAHGQRMVQQASGMAFIEETAIMSRSMCMRKATVPIQLDYDIVWDLICLSLGIRGHGLQSQRLLGTIHLLVETPADRSNTEERLAQAATIRPLPKHSDYPLFWKERGD